MTEQLVDVPRIVGRQAVEDLTWAAGSVGGKVAALGTISSRGESHTANRQPTSLLIADGVRNVLERKKRGGRIFYQAAGYGIVNPIPIFIG